MQSATETPALCHQNWARSCLDGAGVSFHRCTFVLRGIQVFDIWKSQTTTSHQYLIADPLFSEGGWAATGKIKVNKHNTRPWINMTVQTLRRLNCHVHLLHLSIGLLRNWLPPLPGAAAVSEKACIKVKINTTGAQMLPCKPPTRRYL